MCKYIKETTEMGYEERIKIMYIFINAICIEGGCGYDFKKISNDILNGNSNYEQAINEWKYRGHYLL